MSPWPRLYCSGKIQTLLQFSTQRAYRLSHGPGAEPRGSSPWLPSPPPGQPLESLGRCSLVAPSLVTVISIVSSQTGAFLGQCSCLVPRMAVTPVPAVTLLGPCVLCPLDVPTSPVTISFTHTHTHAHTLMCTHAHTHTHTHVNTCTHTHPLVALFSRTFLESPHAGGRIPSPPALHLTISQSHLPFKLRLLTQSCPSLPPDPRAPLRVS